jgi:hypothetical protein
MRYIITILLITSTAHADDWEWGFVVVPMAPFHHVFLHESSHAIAGLSMGHKIEAFKPYPHMYDDRLFLGRVETDSPTPLTDGEKIAFYGAPYLMDVGMFALSDVIVSHMERRSIAGVVIHILGMVAPYIDFVKGYVHSLDWSEMRNTQGATAINILGAAAIAIGTWRIIEYWRNF